MDFSQIKGNQKMSFFMDFRVIFRFLSFKKNLTLGPNRNRLRYPCQIFFGW